MNFTRLLEELYNEILFEKKKSIEVPTNAELIAKRRSPVHKPTKQINPKKGGGYNRQKFKSMDY